METITRKKVTKTLWLTGDSLEKKREEIRTYFHDTFTLDEELFEALQNENAFYKRADPLRHPLIFYFGHTATFFINKLILANILEHRINPEFESMFAVGVDEMSWDDLNEQHYNWPTVEEVREYRNRVRHCVDEMISTINLTLPIQWNSPFWVIVMCIEHIRIHFETSSVLIRQLPLEEVQPIEGWLTCKESGEAPQNELVSIEGGALCCGKSMDSPLYGWDNEYGQLSAEVCDFSASKFLCSNGEFMSFVEAKGYQTSHYWTEEGWKWCQFQKAQHPRFWHQSETGWVLRLMTEMVSMPWDWPVEVNYLEAKAFCNWRSETTGKTIRLPSEEEWIHLHNLQQLPDQPEWEVAPGNINMEHFQSPCPVNKFASGPFFDVIGNVWQWTETPIAGYKGFQVHPFYDDFSVPTFDNQHNLIKGGSWISTGNEATKECRYAFRRHFYQHAGFRYVESESEICVEHSLSETDALVSCNLNEDWGEMPVHRVRFRAWLARFCVQNIPQLEEKRLLDLGCETGRMSFELAPFCAEVVGIDFTARNIQRAVELWETGACSYEFKDEGELTTHHTVALESFGIQSQAENLSFCQADASNLKSLYHGYDVVVVNDSLRSMINPNRFLTSIANQLAPSGYLLVASAYDWDESRNLAPCRPGGFRKDGEPYPGNQGVADLLSHDFEQCVPQKIVLRYRPINRYKYEMYTIEVCLWKRKE